jgi:hypothetical protein
MMTNVFILYKKERLKNLFLYLAKASNFPVFKKVV